MLRLQTQRELLGISRSEAARRAGMHASTISQIESGYIGRPYPSQLAKLVAALEWQGDPVELLEDVSSDASD